VVSNGLIWLINLILHRCYSSCFNSFNKMSNLIIRWTKLIASSKIREESKLSIMVLVVVLIMDKMAHLDNSKCKNQDRTTLLCSNKDKRTLGVECLQFSLHQLWVCLLYQTWCSQINLLRLLKNMSLKLEKYILQFKKWIQSIKTKWVK
jgi:hypothetical protein